MRNWDESEETGNQNCSVEQDLRDAQHICKHLDIPLHEANFIDQYWNRVFSEFVTQYSRGLTPNPDLECNRSIKFDALVEYARDLGAAKIATGHYARLVRSTEGMCAVQHSDTCLDVEVSGAALLHGYVVVCIGACLVQCVYTCSCCVVHN